MPDINEGLEIGGEPVITREEGDVNTQSGFEAGLTRAVTGEAPPTEEEGEEAAPEEEEGAEAPAPEPEPTDWERQYHEAMSLVGRQSAELGDLRARVQEMTPAAPAAPEPLVNVEQLLDQHGGEASINWAIDNAPHLIEPLARSWALSGDPEGAVFYADYRAEQGKIEAAPQAPPEPDPDLQQLSTERKLAGVFNEMRDANPDAFAAIEQGIGPALQAETTPDEIKLMLMSGNLEHMRQGMKFLLPYAQIESFKLGNAQVSSEEPSAEATQKEEQRRDTARRTAIVTGSQRLQDAGTVPESGELTSEQRIERFKEAFEAEPSTSISAGLTINGQPVLPTRPKRS